MTAPPTPTGPTTRPGEALLVAQPVTERVAEFVISTRPSGLPRDVLELGRKSILDRARARRLRLELDGGLAGTPVDR